GDGRKGDEGRIKKCFLTFYGYKRRRPYRKSLVGRLLVTPPHGRQPRNGKEKRYEENMYCSVCNDGDDECPGSVRSPSFGKLVQSPPSPASGGRSPRRAPAGTYRSGAAQWFSLSGRGAAVRDPGEGVKESRA